MRVAIPIAVAALAGGCGLFLDDLSSGGAGPDDAGAPRDVVTADDAKPTGRGDAAVATDAGDAAVDAPKWSPRLDCDGAIICEGFEGITSITAGMPVGTWFDQVDENLGSASIETNDPALGLRAALFVSPVNATGEKRTLLIADNDAALVSGHKVVDVDFDLWLDYVPSAFDGTDRRNLVGMFITSSKLEADWEFAGLSVMTNKGLHAEVREYASATATTKKPGEDPFVSLSGPSLVGAWHHVRLEVTFAKTATGGIRVYVDGELRGQLPGLVTRTDATDAATKFIFWVGASAGIGAPAFTARYDDVEVRTR